MSQLETYLEKTRETVEELNEAEKELFHKKADFSIKSVSLLLQKFSDGLDQLFEGLAGSEMFDKKVRGDLHDAIMKSINAFAQAKHEINFAPNINVDLAPLKAAITGAADQTKLLHGLIEKLSNGTGQQEELFKLITLIGDKQVAAFDKINSMADMRPELATINTTLNKKTDYEVEVTKRDEVRGFFEKATITAVK